MLPLVGLGIGLGGGLLKGGFDAAREARERKVAAATQRYSPWTGMQAAPVRSADIFGSALQGATTGAMVEGSLGSSDVPVTSNVKASPSSFVFDYSYYQNSQNAGGQYNPWLRMASR